MLAAFCFVQRFTGEMNTRLGISLLLGFTQMLLFSTLISTLFSLAKWKTL